MEMKRDHRKHRARDAYELYELEHTPHTLVKGPNDQSRRPKPRSNEVFEPNYYETGRTMTAQPYRDAWANEDDKVFIHKENINDEAEDFIALKHKKFELSKWMSSMNSF